ncbi:MAG: TlpA family protein disulfide reductase [Pyrinomonadaceae bacterium]
MKKFLPLIFVGLCVVTVAQSRRVQQTNPTNQPAVTSVKPDETVKQLFDEANTYIKTKAAEYELKKVPFSDRLYAQTKLEQRQLAAKHAAAAATRTNLAGEDYYYLGMLHWIAENLDGTAENLSKFVGGESAPVERAQTARSIIVVVFAKQKKLVDAEKILAEYLAKEPTKLTERARMAGEMAKAYQAAKDFTRMTPHAEQGYAASKALLKDATSRARGLNEILDAGMLVYEAFRDLGERAKAEAALDDMRVTAAEVGSTSFYYYAVDQKIKFLIETGRKPAALEFYQTTLKNTGLDFTDRAYQNDINTRLKKRDKHYKLLGDSAPELPLADQWFPGNRRSLASLRGKVVLLDFWAMWCQPCFEAFPHLIEWQQDYAGDGLEILGVTRYYGEVNGMDADPAAEIAELKRFRLRERLPYDFVVGDGQAMQLMYGATGLPTAVLIDRNGVVRYIETGTSPARLEQIREMIVKLINEK